MQLAFLHPPELVLDTVDATDLAHEGLFIHDIDPLVPEVPEDFFDAQEQLYPSDPSPANQFINDPFLRGDY